MRPNNDTGTSHSGPAITRYSSPLLFQDVECRGRLTEVNMSTMQQRNQWTGFDVVKGMLACLSSDTIPANIPVLHTALYHLQRNEAFAPSKIVHDGLWGTLSLDAKEVAFLDTSLFQRLHPIGTKGMQFGRQAAISLAAIGFHRFPYSTRPSATMCGLAAGRGSNTTFTCTFNTRAIRRNMLRE